MSGIKEHISVDQAADNTLTAPSFSQLREALEILYIKDNISGRLKFLQSWPETGRFVFGAELIRYDEEGVVDRSRREQLEEEAQARRLSLLDLLAGVDKNSVKDGLINFDHIKLIIERIGLHIAQLVYTPAVLAKAGFSLVDTPAQHPPAASSVFTPPPAPRAAISIEAPQKPIAVDRENELRTLKKGEKPDEKLLDLPVFKLKPEDLMARPDKKKG